MPRYMLNLLLFSLQFPEFRRGSEAFGALAYVPQFTMYSVLTFTEGLRLQKTVWIGSGVRKHGITPEF